MLGLYWETPREWASEALERPGDLLLDHLFCERKAAAMADRLRRDHGEELPTLGRLMDELAAEETEHAERVERFLRELPSGQQPAVVPRGGDAYVRGLRREVRCRRQDAFLDKLLVCSLVEARSAERFRLLARAARGSTLGGFYEDLYASEVGHYLLFVQLATERFGEEPTKARLTELRKREAELIRALPPGPRIH